MIETDESKRFSCDSKKLFSSLLICLWLVISSINIEESLSQEITNPLSLAQIASLRKKLDTPCAQTKENVAFRSAIQDLEDAFKITIWIDRRVDLDCPVSLAVEKQSLEQSIMALAAKVDASVAWIDRVLYIAPREQVDQIEASYWTLFRAWPNDQKKKLQSLEWPDLSEPTKLIRSFAESTGRKIEGVESIEYDLWRAKSLVECNEPAIWSILLAGFDKTLDYDPETRRATIRSIDSNGLVVGEYTTKQIDSKRMAAWKKEWPESKTKKNSSGIGWFKEHRVLSAS